MENSNQSIPDGKTIAILSYVPLIGWVIALIINHSNKTSVGSFHIKQSLGIFLMMIGFVLISPLFFIPFLGWLVFFVLSIGIPFFWVLGLIAAIKAEEKPVPLVGKSFQSWFGSIGK